MIKLLIVEPYKVTRECLRTFLERENDIQVLGEAERLDQAVSQIQRLDPDVVLLDVDLQDSRGLEALLRILVQPCKPEVVVLALFGDLAKKGEFVKAGAKACYCWRDPLTELREAIRSVCEGQTYQSHHASNSMSAQTALPESH